MSNANDVAAYILEQAGPMSTWKLQKLVYYSQAWSLVWDESALFADDIEAWANGPVIPNLYAAHRGRFTVSEGDIAGDPGTLSDDERETVDAVIGFYGEKTGRWLSELTHQEDPWLNAREGLRPGQRGHRAITEGALADYYGSL
jgi:uncharacterized phage-associated protein